MVISMQKGSDIMTGRPIDEANTAHTDLISFYEAQAKQNGLSVPMLRVLEAVCRDPGCTQKALCDNLQTTKQRVHTLVRALEEKKLLRLSENEADGRSRRLFLTQAGEQIMGRLLAGPQHASFPSGEHAHTHVLEDGTVITHTHSAGHGHTHSHAHTKAVSDRLARSIGHLEKVRQMVESGVDCSEVLIQLSAVKAAINSTGKLILKDHIEHCLVDAIEHGDRETVEELNKAIDQFIK